METLNVNIEQVQKERAKVTMMWIGIVAIVMLFAGLTSAYILRLGQKGWESIDIPTAFIISTMLIVISSGTMWFALNSIKQGNQGSFKMGMLATLLLGIGFVVSQFVGYSELRDTGHFFVGENPASAFMYAITFVHIAHLAGGLLFVFSVWFKGIRKGYTAQNYLPVRLCSIYWHFLDILWLYLLVFFYFIR